MHPVVCSCTLHCSYMPVHTHVVVQVHVIVGYTQHGFVNTPFSITVNIICKDTCLFMRLELSWFLA